MYLNFKFLTMHHLKNTFQVILHVSKTAYIYNITANFWWRLVTHSSIAFYTKISLRAFLWDFDLIALDCQIKV